MNHSPIRFLIAAVVIWLALLSIGPLLVGLFQTAIPLAIVIGAIVIATRLIWYFTNSY